MFETLKNKKDTSNPAKSNTDSAKSNTKQATNTKQTKKDKKKSKKGGEIDQPDPTPTVQQRPSFFGNSYPYYQNIKTPNELGMSDKGTLSALGKDVKGLVSYIDLLVSGKSQASVTGQPLGNKYFLPTGAQCTDISSGQLVDRSVYINNIPSGNIPFVSTGLGTGNFKDFRGLIPGMVSNLNAFDPTKIMNSFNGEAYPKCRAITMDTVDVNNSKFTETNYVALNDIEDMDACWFPNKVNPITGKKCKEGFQNAGDEGGNSAVDVAFYTTLGALGILMITKLMMKV